MLHSTFNDGFDLHSKENRQRLAQIIMRLFKHWDLESRDQATLLGLSPDTRTTLSRYRNGSPLANHPDLLARAGHLLGIHKSLRQIFPQNIELAYQWVSQPNCRFNNHSPLQIMRQGYEGLLAVRRYLDFERGQ